MWHLIQDERNQIEILISKWYWPTDIWMVLERDKSVISREIKRNSVNWIYSSKKASIKSYMRRKSVLKQIKKIRHYDACEQYIREHLVLYRSPELIAWSWNNLHPEYTISHVLVYQYVYSRFWYDLTQYLYLKRRRSKKRKTNIWKREMITNRTWIDFRPPHIWLLQEIWHYEADLIVWPKYWSKYCLLTLVEKVTRTKFAYIIPSRSPQLVTEKLLEMIKKFSVKSITFDNGIEFKWHLNLWIPTYFCRPYHSWEKWQIEYSNRLYRIFIPKWSDLCKFNQTQIDSITNILNLRPMKCLKFNSPISLFLPSLHLAL
jgi:IS30 family transposase